MTEEQERQYTDDEERALARQLLAVTQRVYAGAVPVPPLRRALVCDLHASLFAGVRSHAGRIREPGRGSEYLVFGPNRSARSTECPRLLDNALESAARRLDALLERPEIADYEIESVRLAVRLHADVVRIHPFEDGNGRTSRLLMNVVLVAAGVAPIEVEVFKQEYNECLNHYFRTGSIDPLVDLMLRTYDAEGKLRP